MSGPNNVILNLIIGLSPFVDESGQVYICRPMYQEEGRPTEYVEAPLNSPQTRRYVKAVFGPHARRGYLTEAETKTIIEMIEGQALCKPPRPLSNCTPEVVQQNPLALAVRRLAEQGPTRAAASNLLTKLNSIVRQHGIKVDQLTWPTTEDALGVQLTDLVRIMRLMGVILFRHENARPRAWTICLVEDAPPGQGVEGVGEASPPTSLLNGASDVTATSDTPDTPVKPLMLGYTPSQGIESTPEKAQESLTPKEARRSECKKNSKKQGGQA